jgi:hypothetical protein
MNGASNYGDFCPPSGLPQSLDRTIERLGRDRFDRALTKRRPGAVEIERAPARQISLLGRGKAQSRSKRASYLPFHDFGCGYKCIDQMIDVI